MLDTLLKISLEALTSVHDIVYYLLQITTHQNIKLQGVILVNKCSKLLESGATTEILKKHPYVLYFQGEFKKN